MRLNNPSSVTRSPVSRETHVAFLIVLRGPDGCASHANRRTTRRRRGMIDLILAVRQEDGAESLCMEERYHRADRDIILFSTRKRKPTNFVMVIMLRLF